MTTNKSANKDKDRGRDERVVSETKTFSKKATVTYNTLAQFWQFYLQMEGFAANVTSPDVS